MSNILVCCLGNGVVFILHILFAALQHILYVENERSSIYVSPCRVCMAYINYVNGRCIVVLFQKNIVWEQD